MMRAHKMAVGPDWMVTGEAKCWGHFPTEAAALAYIARAEDGRLARDAVPAARSPDPLLDRFFHPPQRSLLDRMVCP